jgi:hypothetical protein
MKHLSLNVSAHNLQDRSKPRLLEARFTHKGQEKMSGGEESGQGLY